MKANHLQDCVRTLLDILPIDCERLRNVMALHRGQVCCYVMLCQVEGESILLRRMQWGEKMGWWLWKGLSWKCVARALFGMQGPILPCAFRFGDFLEESVFGGSQRLLSRPIVLAFRLLLMFVHCSRRVVRKRMIGCTKACERIKKWDEKVDFGIALCSKRVTSCPTKHSERTKGVLCDLSKLGSDPLCVVYLTRRP